MSDTTASESAASIVALQKTLVDRILTGVTLLAAVGAPISLSRAAFTGWLPMYGIHAVLAVLLLLCWLCRRHIPNTAKMILILFLFWAVGIVGLHTLGLLSAGAWWLVTSALLVEIVYGPNKGYVAVVFVGVVVSVFALLFTSGKLTIGVDANQFIAQPAAWATFAVGAVLQPLIVFSAVGQLQATVVKLNAQVSAKSAEIQLLADTDELTLLPRRHVAVDRLQQTLLDVKRNDRMCGVLFFDLDGFKAINDQYGHATGDRILKVTAQRCRDVLRESDTIARLGGDEFLVILPQLADRDDAQAIARKLLTAITAPIGSDSTELQVGVSIGIALGPVHGQSAQALIDRADGAMYEAKRSGSNQIRTVT